MQLCQNLCPSDGSYTLAKQDEELVIMTLIQALPAEFDSFMSALLLQSNIDKAKVIEAFVTEESNRLHCLNQSAMLTHRQIVPPTLTQTSSKWCNFCDSSAHNTDVCFQLANAKNSNLECRQTARQDKKQRMKDQKAQQPDTGVSPSPPEAEAAGSASTITSLSSHLSAHIISNASYLWYTDSGASAHMTPHRHWFKELKLHKVPIKLADNSVVYYEGIGTVIFQPKDTKLSPILLSDVLYVPQL